MFKDFLFPNDCNSGLFLIDVSKIICLSSPGNIIIPFELKLDQDNASLEYSCIQHF